MPKELARVMKRYGDLRSRWNPVSSQLSTNLHEYVMRMDSVALLENELQELLRSLNATSATHPNAVNHNYVKSLLKDIKKHRALAEDRRDNEANKQAAALIPEVVTLQRDVAAVIKSKSGVFSTSKSLPALTTLSDDLLAFAKTLHKAAAGA